MRIIDKTPYQSESGKINLLDQLKATLKYGADWLEEINAQKTVIAHLENALDNSYTLLRNVTLAGLGATIPLILVGPSGIYVMYTTALQGKYRAKGDAWGTLVGYKFKQASINLLIRTAQMGRAVQVYLERQGYISLTPIESVLLATKPGLHVDSIRPIVRVVLSDALERFAASITQAHVVFSAEAVHDILNRITNSHPALCAAPTRQEPHEPLAGQEPQAAQSEASSAKNEYAPPLSWEADTLGLDSTQESMDGQAPAAGGLLLPELETPAPTPATIQPGTAARLKKLPFSSKQWAFLIVFIVVEITILITFVVLVISNL
ncbi:MAG: hypothetical protein Q7U34_05980 [Anaerolineales bacterium]|nr:hypothetical protein [Anaerolineales bacterium]